MKTEENHSIIKLALFCFKYSLIIGTIIFLAFWLTDHEEFIIIGLFYLICAFFINILMLLILVVSLITNSDRYMETLKTIGIMLLNIPIAWFYFFLVTGFL